MKYRYEIIRESGRYAVIRYGRTARKMLVSPYKDCCEEYIARKQRTEEYRERKARHE